MKNTMKHSVLLLLCAVIAISACLAGCSSNEPNFPIAVSDSTRSALELCTKGYKDGELEKIYSSMTQDKTAKSLHDEYEIQCLRKTEDGYTVLYTGNTRVLVLRFDQAGKYQKADKLQSLYRMVDTRGRFDKIKEGDSVTAVQSADPTCYFPFLVDRESGDLKTDHYSEDGYHTTILYDKDFTVTSVTYELM